MLNIWTQSTDPENTNGSWYYIVDQLRWAFWIQHQAKKFFPKDVEASSRHRDLKHIVIKCSAKSEKMSPHPPTSSCVV